MVRFLENIKSIINEIDRDNISEFAAEISFFIILSLVPFIIFFFSIFKYTNLEYDFIIFLLNEFIPNGTENFFLDLINENYLKSFNIISISGIFALWSASKGIYSLMKGIRYIYKENSKKSIIVMKIEACIFTLIFIFSILIVLFTISFGNNINIIKNNIIFCMMFEVFGKFKNLLFTILLFLLFFAIYVIIPKKYSTITKQIPGAIFSSITWYFITLFFSLYLNIFENFSNIYGSFASIILVMMWIYVCVYMILIGAKINITYERYKNY